MRNMPFVYILECGDGSFYTGAAFDWEKRLREHRTGKGAKYTRGRQPLSVVFLHETATWSEALAEEARIKKLRRPQKEKLISSFDSRRTVSPAEAEIRN